ncbi:hypothetical protein BD626DRAFT_529370 [Schizophyllum amplum]|uniref:Uncharacterized protein n=1 Tax=Schizophyllum amplum TaxID=97359 RepID=A0A550BRW0_9AGAR|nr:hypothetical protein BD626DRAFT_529370 [Auriculariopsis ampla]
MGDIEDIGRAHILRVLVNVVPRASTCSRSYVSEYHTLDLTFLSGWVFRNSLSTAQVNLTLATSPLFLAPASSAAPPNLPLPISSETHRKFNLLRCTTSTSYHAPSTEERAAGNALVWESSSLEVQHVSSSLVRPLIRFVLTHSGCHPFMCDPNT